jgi:hypothetical protein
VVVRGQRHGRGVPYSPEGLDATTRGSCAALIELARAGNIILPLSRAHLVATSRLDGESRHELAMTMLQLSRGWQMRTPLDVRQNELHRFDSRT